MSEIEAKCAENWVWSKDSTKLMLELYKENVDKFRDPKIKKKSLWAEILREMIAAGYLLPNEDMLDKKMRNMKSTYKKIKDNNKQTGRGRITWEYFEIFEEIFKEDKTINIPSTISSFPVEGEIVAVEGASSSFLTETFEELVENLDSEEEPPKKKKARKQRESYKVNKTLVEIEKQRQECLQTLIKKIEESNEIQKERNELLKQLLQK